MKVLAISGSLRALSSNTAVLRAAGALAPPPIEFVLFEGIGNLPHFNPDLDGEDVPRSVTAWRMALHGTDAVVFSVPEYAHGIPGVMKNALDWVVGSGELAEKPVALFHPSSRGAYALASLSETLTVMAAQIVPEAAVTLQTLGKSASEDSIQRDAEMSAKLRCGLEALSRFVLAMVQGRDTIRPSASAHCA